MDLRYLQAFLGHANLNTLAVYTQVGIKALKDLHQVMHPVAGLPGELGRALDGEHDDALMAEALLDSLEEEGEDEDAR